MQMMLGVLCHFVLVPWSKQLFFSYLGNSGQHCLSLSFISAPSSTTVIDTTIVRPFWCGFWGKFFYGKHPYQLCHLSTSHIHRPHPLPSYFSWTKILRDIISLRCYEQVFIWMGHKLPQVNVKTVWSLDHNFRRSGRRLLTFGDILFFKQIQF